MGFSSMLLQITVLRLLLSTFSGNELDIGITLSFWLGYVGIGSFAGKVIKSKHFFAISFVLSSILALPTAFAIKAIRAILSLEIGETVSFADTLMSTGVILFPLCFIIGIQFPLAVSYSGDRNAPRKIYGLEAAGAFIAGILFTFVFSGKVGAFELCLLLSIFNIFLALYVSRKIIILAISIIPVLFYSLFHTTAIFLPWQGMDISRILESRYGEIAVVRQTGQSSIYANGNLLFTYPDVPVEETKAHLPMSLHPAPSHILIIGGSAGVIEEVLKYPVTHVDFVELDPKIVDISLYLLSEGGQEHVLNDQRIKIINEDGRKYIKGIGQRLYDLIILNLPQPTTAGINRFYTTDFFREARVIMKNEGILALNLPFSTGYIGKSMQIASGSVYNSLQKVFEHVEVTAQEYGFLFASQSPIITAPEKLEKRFFQRALSTEYFHPYLFYDAFAPFNAGYVRERLSEINLINSDVKPSAYLYNIMLWAEIHGGKALAYLIQINKWYGLLFISIIFLGFFLFGFRRLKRTVYFSVLSTGFSGMSIALVAILAYQAMFGYVYEMIGILSASFMIGLWAGTALTKNLRKALQTLLLIDITMVILCITASLFFKSEEFLYLLIFFAGTLTGAQFSTANSSIGKLEIAGKLYGLDLIGSFAGSIIPSIIIIPLFGIYNTLLVVATVKAFSALMISLLLINPKNAIK